MKRFFSLLLITAMTISIFSATAISTQGINESESIGFTLDITAPEFYVAGEEISISVTVNNITAEKGIHYIYGRLYFNAELLGFSFETKENLAINAFGGYKEWEDFSVLKIDADGRWYISVSAATAGYTDSETGEWKYSGDVNDGDLIFNFNFVAKENATGGIVLEIPDLSAEGSYIDPETYEETVYVGNGSIVTVSEKVDESSEDESDTSIGIPEIQTGDINGNGGIDSMDYLYLKRAFFKQYTLPDMYIGDINNNGMIDSMDYLYLKRAFFKQYVIQ